MELAPMDRPALFARLAAGPAARITILTPNQRLAQALVRDFDREQLARGRASWEAPDAIAWSAFLARAHEDLAYGPDPLPLLLSAAEERVLWEEALRSSAWRDVLSVSATAALAMEAWETAHAWRIEGAYAAWPGSEDAEAFAAWSAAYAAQAARRGFTDAARLPALVATRLAGLAARPEALVAYGFDLPTPQQRDFLAACANAGIDVFRCEPPRVPGRAVRVDFESPRKEIEQAAHWARSRLEAAPPGSLPRIGLVVPDLGQRRREVERVFGRVLAPQALPGAAPRLPLFNLSIGEPLSGEPLVAAALSLLDFAFAPVDFALASRVLRSPFLAHAEQERDARARLDAALRRIAPASVALSRLRSLLGEAGSLHGAPPTPRLAEALEGVEVAAREHGAAPAHEWARRFSALLAAAGFPGERTVDSREHQALEKLREVLTVLATLGNVAPSWSAGDARSRLRLLCAETLFQSASGEAPIQVLGILESSGLAFDHLWIAGMTEDAWPLAARSHPLLPAALQTKAGIPQASPARSLEVDRALTAAWHGAAPEVVFSHARAQGDRELLPSPLVEAVPVVDVAALQVESYATWREALFAAGRAPGAVTVRDDERAPPLPAGPAPGGTGILAGQAACPFKAFAHFRLDARALESPEPGLGPLERGLLLHELMALLWGALGSHAGLLATPPEKLSALVEQSAAHAVARVRAERPGRLEDRFAELERERLAQVAHAWLEIDRAREPFEVVQREERVALAAGPLQLSGRVDRMDRLANGALAVIDYKTGQASVSAWLGERPDDLQLPLYALASGIGRVEAVAFGRMKVGELGYAGLARQDGLLAGAQAVESHRTAKKLAAGWDELLGHWRRQVEALGTAFAAGDARVDPKRALATCQRCELKPLCRVHERLGAFDEGEGGEEEQE